MTHSLLEALINLSELRPKPPHPIASFGTYIGPINFNNHCWETRGHIRELFNRRILTEVITHLSTCPPSPPSEDRVTISCYLVGKSPLSASPTIMFISENADYRKEARKAIKDSDILSRYPGFKTAHISKDPGFQKIEQLASADLFDPMSQGKTLATDVLYDPSRGFSHTGIPIYVRHSASIRTATANVVELHGRAYLQTVYHAFVPSEEKIQKHHATYDDDFEIDSDVEEEIDEDTNIAITSIGSRSPDTWSLSDSSVDETSRAVRELSGRSTPILDDSNYFEGDETNSMLQQATNELLTFGCSQPTYGMRQLKQPPEDCLLPLGRLWKSSPEKDWALIEITATSVQDLLRGTDNLCCLDTNPSDCMAEINNNDVAVEAHTSTGRIEGTLSGSRSCTKLPNSLVFQQVCVVRLRGPLANGDCGSSIIDSSTGELYGHIVAGCRTSGSAYVIPASETRKDLDRIKQQVLGHHHDSFSSESKQDLRPLTTTFSRGTTSYHAGVYEATTTSECEVSATELEPEIRSELPFRLPSISGFKLLFKFNHLTIISIQSLFISLIVSIIFPSTILTPIYFSIAITAMALALISYMLFQSLIWITNILYFSTRIRLVCSQLLKMKLTAFHSANRILFSLFILCSFTQLSRWIGVWDIFDYQNSNAASIYYGGFKDASSISVRPPDHTKLQWEQRLNWTTMSISAFICANRNPLSSHGFFDSYGSIGLFFLLVLPIVASCLYMPLQKRAPSPSRVPSLGFWHILCLVINKIIGTGIFSLGSLSYDAYTIHKLFKMDIWRGAGPLVTEMFSMVCLTIGYSFTMWPLHEESSFRRDQIYSASSIIRPWVRVHPFISRSLGLLKCAILCWVAVEIFVIQSHPKQAEDIAILQVLPYLTSLMIVGCFLAITLSLFIVTREYIASRRSKIRAQPLKAPVDIWISEHSRYGASSSLWKQLRRYGSKILMSFLDILLCYLALAGHLEEARSDLVNERIGYLLLRVLGFSFTVNRLGKLCSETAF